MLALLMMVMFTPLSFITTDANAAPVQYSAGIGYDGGVVTWEGFGTKYTISYGNTDMIYQTEVDYVNQSRKIYIRENTSTSQRVASVTAKKNGTAVAVLRIVQDGKPQPHTHSWGNWIVTKNATCDTCGSKYHACSCGATETKTIYPNGHSFECIAQTSATCTKSGTITMKCKNCPYKFTTSTAPALGHKYSYHYNSSTGRITGTCLRSGCGNQDLDVTYDDYLKYEKLSNTKDSQQKYLVIISAALPESITVDQIMKSRNELEKKGINNYKSALSKCKDVLGFTAGAFEWGIDAYKDSTENYNAQLSNYKVNQKLTEYDVANKLSTTCKFVGIGLSCVDFFSAAIKKNKTPRDYIELISAAAGFADQFNVFSSAMSGMPDLVEKLEINATKYYNKEFFYSAMDYEVTLNGVTKPLTEVTLYELLSLDTQCIIKAACLNINGSEKAANNMIKFLRESKQAYIAYLLENPWYTGDYENYCQYHM